MPAYCANPGPHGGDCKLLKSRLVSSAGCQRADVHDSSPDDRTAARLFSSKPSVTSAINGRFAAALATDRAHSDPGAEPDDDWHEPMYEEYRSFTLGLGKDLASYEQLKEERGLLWPVVDGKETRYRNAADHDPYVTKSDGVHFYKAK